MAKQTANKSLKTKTGQQTVPAATIFDLNVRFEGAFIFLLKAAGGSSDPNAKLAGVEVYAPMCGHTASVSINAGLVYMMESYWHCIDVVHGPKHRSSGLTAAQLKTKIGANTPWVAANRPMGSGWDVAFKLPMPPDDWQNSFLVSGAKACFSGRDATIIPGTVALEQMLVYKNVSSALLHGACFPADFTPVNGVVDLHIQSEVAYIPTKQHERRACDALAGLLGLDLMLENSLIPIPAATTAAQPRWHAGDCMMGIVTGP